MSRDAEVSWELVRDIQIVNNISLENRNAYNINVQISVSL